MNIKVRCIEHGCFMKLVDAIIYRLRAIMAERSITPYYFHKEGGIAKSTISKVFNGKQQNISMNLLYEFISTLNISLKEFFDDPIFEHVTD